MSDDLIEIYNDLKNIFTNDNIELNKKFVKINLENKDESLYIKELDTIEKKWANKNYSFVEINNTIMIMDYNEGRSFLKTQTFKKTKEINIIALIILKIISLIMVPLLFIYFSIKYNKIVTEDDAFVSVLLGMLVYIIILFIFFVSSNSRRENIHYLNIIKRSSTYELFIIVLSVITLKLFNISIISRYNLNEMIILLCFLCLLPIFLSINQHSYRAYKLSQNYNLIDEYHKNFKSIFKNIKNFDSYLVDNNLVFSDVILTFRGLTGFDPVIIYTFKKHTFLVKFIIDIATTLFSFSILYFVFGFNFIDLLIINFIILLKLALSNKEVVNTDLKNLIFSIYHLDKINTL